MCRKLSSILDTHFQAALPRVDGSPSPRSSMDSDSTSSTHRRPGSTADDRYGRTLAAMEELRESLRQEHCCYLQVRDWFSFDKQQSGSFRDG